MEQSGILSVEGGRAWRVHVVASALVLGAIFLIAVWTRLWVLTSVPVGFLFGFLLQRGDLCGASAFSEVLLMRDWRKVFGLWVCIVVSMGAFALLEALGWATLRPKPFYPLNHIVGGVIFGVGMVLGGGCVTGSLFKVGTGNLNSMAALVGIPLGVAMIEYGPLRSAHVAMKKLVVRAADGGPLSLPAITGLSFGAIALALGAVTLVVALVVRRGRRKRPPGRTGLGGLLTRSWKPWQAGVAIGLLAGPALLSSAAAGRNYPLGVTHGVLEAQQLVTDRDFEHRWRPGSPSGADRTAGPKGKKIVWWLVGLVTSLVVGSWTSARWSGQARLLPKPPGQTVVAFFGGILVGVGAGLGMGCVAGNIMSGWALMSVGSFVFGFVTMLASWAATYFYLMGGTLIRSR